MFRKWWFWVIIIVAIVIIISIFSSESPEKKSENILPYYSIVKIEDVSYANIKRLVYNVVISEEVTIDQMKLVVKDIVEKAKNKEKFNAFSIMMYDYPEFIGYGYTLGKAVFAPEGDWAKADTVKAGSYNEMDFGWVDLKYKDWSKRLNKKEVEIWKAWQDKYSEETKKSSELPDENKITKWVAEQFGISEDEVKNIFIKYAEWITS